MRVSELKLTNFRPFYGENEINLTPVGRNSLVLVHGENQSGKTAFFLALYWCLFGTAKNRLGVSLPVFQRGEEENDYLINRKAVEEGATEMHVEVTFEHEGRLWHLTRVATCDGDPFDGGEFKSEALLQIDDEPITTAEIDRRINDVLHADAAQFYFFDGELLSQYEQWLADPVQAQTRVKDAIERTVGISAFRLGRHLATVAEEFQKEVNKAQRKEKKNQDLLDDRDRAEKRRVELESEIREYAGTISELTQEADRMQARHGDLSDWNTAQEAIVRYEAQIQEEQDKERSAVREIQSLVRERYWMPLDRVGSALDTALLAQLEEAISSRSALKATSLAADVCSLCERDLDGDLRSQFQHDIDAGGESVLRSVDELREALFRLEQARRFIDPSALPLLETLEAKVTAARIEIANCEDKAEKLRRQHPVKGDLKKEMERLKQIHQELGRLENDKRGAEQDLTEKQEELRALDARIAKSGTADPAVSKRSRAAALAAAAFDDALEAFANRSRERVKSGATEAFKALVRDEGFDGIDIDERYTVRPVDCDGRVQTAPSSGGQQLLTLALIAGLNSTAVHDAPIVMDTPFGRLDVGNRERILRWVNELVRAKDQQVVLMVHSGELTRDDLREWKIAPGRSYRIVTKDVHEHHVVEA